MNLEPKLAPIKARYNELSALMAEGNLSGEDYVKLSKEYADLSPIVETIERYQQVLKEREEAEAMIDDPEMSEIARQEIYRINEEIPALEQQIKLALIPKDKADNKNAIVEIRAGTGGEEAALFALELFQMYQGYVSTMGWKMEILEASYSDLGGIKEIVASVTGNSVFSYLKFESGVHRVQRVPKTESGGRIHTSAATVAVLPEAEDIDVEIRDSDLRIDTFRSQGAGGQHVNTTDSAVRLTHHPTGVVVSMQDEKSQHKNKAKAMKVLMSRILDMERQKQASEIANERKMQVGSGDRSERIRTYNYPQGRVTDHRINLTLYKLEEILSGSALNEIVEALQTEENAKKLSNIDSV